MELLDTELTTILSLPKLTSLILLDSLLLFLAAPSKPRACYYLASGVKTLAFSLSQRCFTELLRKTCLKKIMKFP